MTEQRQPLETVKTSDGAYRIEDNGVRTLVFTGTEKALVVDSGFGQSGSIRRVIETLTDRPLMLVNTHADGDHIGGNGEFETAWMHPAEMAYYYTRVNTPNPSVSSLWEGNVIDIGGRRFEVIHIPGHTPGSIALLDRENRILISGDTISYGPVFMFGDVRSLPAYIDSLEKLMKMQDLFDVIYPSHGPFPVEPVQIEKAHRAAIKLASGKLSPQEPTMPIPAKMYEYEGASFFF